MHEPPDPFRHPKYDQLAKEKRMSPSQNALDAAIEAAASSGVGPTANTFHTFNSGAKRSVLESARYDLIPSIVLKRLALRYGQGSVRYGDNNWKKGLPLSDTFNHLMEHLQTWKAFVESGVMPADDDLAGAMWGIAALMWFEVEYARTKGAAYAADTRTSREDEVP